MDWTVLGALGTTAALMYGFLRNFKTDVLNRLDRIDSRLLSLESRVHRIEGYLFGIERPDTPMPLKRKK